VGVYKDAHGRTPILQCVKAAEQRLVEQQTTKSYLPIDGDPAYGSAVLQLALGEHARQHAGRLTAAHTPGGTGALRVAADLVHQLRPGTTVWMPDPTWANHPAVFAAAGLTTRTYRYFDPQTNALDLPGMLEDLAAATAGDVVLLHGCCHNPTGVDPELDQWQQIAKAITDAGPLPLVDMAYQGFGEGLDADAAGLRTIAATSPQMIACTSFSKNFALYNERVGALIVLAPDADASAAVQSRVKQTIRRNYSNPPAHGGHVVRDVLGDDGLRRQWLMELNQMRDRIQDMREAFRTALDERKVSLADDGNSFIAQQNGMFTMSGLSREQVVKLRDDHAIYIVGSGRINVAGMTRENIPRLADATAAVVS
jgi:aspartate/tyrosine/aromatic aminotransferase